MKSNKNCTYCGSPLSIALDKETMTCRYCHHEITIEQDNNFKVNQQNQLEKAAEYRNKGDFIQADSIYRSLLEEDVECFQARWGTLLCKYGVIYAERDDGSRVIFCRKKVESDILSETDYFHVLNQASVTEKVQYEKDANTITNIQNEIRRIENNNYDIFICYKQTEDKTGVPTHDSYEIDLLVNKLKHDGYKVFYAKESLVGKGGSDYAAEIFNAVRSAKVMLVIGSKKEYFFSKWMKIEWSCFLDEIEQGNEKLLIPYFKSFDPYLLPPEFARKNLQAINWAWDERNDYTDLRLSIRKAIPDEINTTMNFEEKSKIMEDKVLQGITELEKGETDTAIKCLLMAGNAGNPQACFLLGNIYFEQEENEKAFEWMKRAAERNIADAQFLLGYMYQLGVGTTADLVRSENWFRKARMNGYKNI